MRIHDSNEKHMSVLKTKSSSTFYQWFFFKPTVLTFLTFLKICLLLSKVFFTDRKQTFTIKYYNNIFTKIQITENQNVNLTICKRQYIYPSDITNQGNLETNRCTNVFTRRLFRNQIHHLLKRVYIFRCFAGGFNI